MNSVSIGIPAVSPSRGNDEWKRNAGFTLIEALVALALLAVFAASLDPLLYHARRIFVQSRGEVRAETLLRSLCQTPFNRVDPEIGTHDGEDQGMTWTIDVEPYGAPIAENATAAHKARRWRLYRAKVVVAWGDGQAVTAETLQLGQVR
jgi:prepilin-type N-terminal cleavage/methylation domain-containing protein